jgi:serine protease Do
MAKPPAAPVRLRPLLSEDAMSLHQAIVKPRGHSKERLHVFGLFLLILFAFVFGSRGSLLRADPRRSPIVDAVQRVRGAVVNIHSERTVMGPAAEELFALAPSQNRINGMGTGVLVDPRGYIVTNHHVVEDVHVIRIRLNDGSTYSARVLARDPEADLALLKIDAGRPLPIAPLGTAKDLMVGETVVAIGNAYGYEHTVTVGVVSALKRDVTLSKEISYKGLIQTDASINPGNSGGPLLNVNGEVVGINVAIRAGAQGISFAIPVDSVMATVADMIGLRKRQGLWHGLVGDNRVETAPSLEVRVSNESPKPEASTPGWKRTLVVDHTEPGSPAARAGFQPDDVVVRVADLRVTSSLDLERALLDHAAGEHIPVVVRRNGTEQRLDLVLQAEERPVLSQADLIWTKLGIRLGSIDIEAVTRTNPQLHGGLSALDVRANGAAAKAGIQRGDILVGLHQWETLNLDNVVFVLNHPDLPNLNPLAFYIIRSGQLRKGWLQHLD